MKKENLMYSKEFMQHKGQYNQWTNKEFMKHCIDKNINLSRKDKTALKSIFDNLSESELKAYRRKDKGKYFYNSNLIDDTLKDHKLRSIGLKKARTGDKSLQGTKLTTFRQGNNLYIDGYSYYKQSKQMKNELKQRLNNYHKQGLLLDIKIR